MAQTILALEAQLDRLNAILTVLHQNLYLHSSNACHEALHAVRQFEGELKRHAQLLSMYRSHYAETHWVVKYLLDSLLLRAEESADRAKATEARLLRSLMQQKTDLTPVTRRQLHKLVAETSSMIDVEQKVLMRMLSLLMRAPTVTVTHYQLQLVKS
jgi:hypothetical protein